LWKRGWQDNGMRLEHDPETSRRLIWCLLMRVLVEQTERSIQQWPGGLNVLGDGGQGKVESRDVAAVFCLP
jgi:CRISPR-associated endonuclease/helicase Cas3